MTINVLVDSKWRKCGEWFYTYWRRIGTTNIVRIQSRGVFGDGPKIIKKLTEELTDDTFNITAPDLRYTPTFRDRSPKIPQNTGKH